MDSYNWFVSTNIKSNDAKVHQAIIRQRDYLLTLRNEDERERYVKQCREELNEIIKENAK